MSVLGASPTSSWGEVSEATQKTSNPHICLSSIWADLAQAIRTAPSASVPHGRLRMGRSRRPDREVRLLRKTVEGIRLREQFHAGFQHGLAIGVLLVVGVLLIELLLDGLTDPDHRYPEWPW